MKKLATALARALRESNLERSVLISRTKIGPTAISRYLTAKAIPTTESLVKIMFELPEKQALDVFSAYIKEVLPPVLVDKVSINKSLTTDAVVSQPLVDDELNDSIEFLKELATGRNDIKTILINLSDVLKNR